MRIFPIRALFGSSLILLASCVGTPEQRSAPQSTPFAAPVMSAPATSAPAPAPVEWQYRPATLGNWSYRADDTGSLATFAGPANGPLLALRCDLASRRISITRTGVMQSSITIRTSYGATSWPATAASAGTTAARAANDATLDQIAYSRGRFAVEVAEAQPLIVPAWGEVGRVIEDCRAS